MSLALSHIHKHISGALIDKKGKCSAEPISSRRTLPALQNAPEHPSPVRLTIKHFVPAICHSVRVPAYQYYVVKGRETKGKTSPITEHSHHTVHRQPRLQGLLCRCKYFFFSPPVSLSFLVASMRQKSWLQWHPSITKPPWKQHGLDCEV